MTAPFDDRYRDADRGDPAPPDVNLAGVWHRVAGDVWAPDRTGFERLAARLLHSPALARALVTTPSLVVSWLLATVLIVGLGVLMSTATDQPWVPLLAPVVAVVGLSFVYGSGADPAWAIMQTMATPRRMVLLVRVAAVFGTNLVIALGASILVEQALAIVLLWLLPMVALSMLALAFATWTQSPMFGAASGLLVWLAVALQGMAGAGDPTAFVQRDVLAGMAPLYLATTLIALVVVLIGSGGAPGQNRWEALRW